MFETPRPSVSAGQNTHPQERAPGPIRGVLFDKDGTLFDLNATWSVYCDRALAAFASGDPQLQDRLAQACGYDRMQRRLAPDSIIVAGSAVEVNAAWHAVLPDWSVEEVDRVARQLLEDLPVCPLGDLPTLLGTLRGMGLHLGIATNDYEAGAILQVRAAGIEGYFDFICGSDSGFGSKPGPAMPKAFATHIGCTTDEVVMVGDSLHDLKSGLAAGCGMTIAVTTGYETTENLSALTSHILRGTKQLPSYLQDSSGMSGHYKG